MLQTWILPIVLSYLIGSISFSYMIAKLTKGIDIRNHGSGNAGATNTLRVLGKLPGIIVFILDALKGMAAVGIGYLLANGEMAVWMSCGIAAIAGHNWPIFLRFRGGKGIATTIGVTSILVFFPALGAGILAILFIMVTRYVSLGSLIYTASLPIFIMLFDSNSSVYFWLSLVMMVLAIIRHKENIVNLLKGKERKI
ncbi:glycerol-3-phosphate 1-O-acyltransferase PlsY [Thermoflavimicrobium daqui]|jgi:glycerol-3-phosphate acyltransferase PlsY|uniref:Glycerol-3-phosphate acyltransferase n=1 Tax=Thermoflavimicrobium daqui TaxID=2137476 RepID=A0A364K2J3_9BACL|nr:glycerol-3-phosphate 1-O-acyltransferase PlsY [Thermoflavimicrobium daqui]RAL22645.1 acyl-phosphate glycerol 3-phosphate acyltransferase [Thermoflavimicrobium daqui]